MKSSVLPFPEIGRVTLSDTTLCFLRDGETVVLMVFPSARENDIPVHRMDTNDANAVRSLASRLNLHLPAVMAENLFYMKLAEDDAAPGLCLSGISLRHSATMKKLKFQKLQIEENEAKTFFYDCDGRFEIVHHLAFKKDRFGIEAYTEIRNSSERNLELELLESLSLGFLSPFQETDGCGCYRIHRFRSFWSAEGRAEIRSVEELGLEAAWAPFAGRSLRFGQHGSMPVKEFFPFLGFEDTRAGVVWAIQSAALGPWQLEVSRISDFLNISGGLPDSETAAWRKILHPGETFRSESVIFTCVEGRIDDALARLSLWIGDHAWMHPENEKELPVVFNEYCSSWGKPFPENLNSIAEVLERSGVYYFVLDSGWFVKPGGVGDWEINESRYPGGFAAFLDSLRAKGFVPGIWFEFENCEDSSAPGKDEKLTIKMNGKPFAIAERRFLDFRKPETWTYIDEKMLALLKKYQIGYLKVDYNYACLGADTGKGSPREGLCEHLRAVRDYYRHLRNELPELVVEICASGGHRLSAEWLRIGDLASFSDAHEAEAIPLIAANTMRLIPMSRNLVWATLRQGDSDERLFYTLSAAFLGRFCLSGDIAELSGRQKQVMFSAIALYRFATDFIREGKTDILRSMSLESYNHPDGFQLVRRRNKRGELVILHLFRDAPRCLNFEVESDLKIEKQFSLESVEIRQEGRKISLENLKDFSAVVLVLIQK